MCVIGEDLFHVELTCCDTDKLNFAEKQTNLSASSNSLYIIPLLLFSYFLFRVELYKVTLPAFCQPFLRIVPSSRKKTGLESRQNRFDLCSGFV